jgi:hypothetical protein
VECRWRRKRRRSGTRDTSCEQDEAEVGGKEAEGGFMLSLTDKEKYVTFVLLFLLLWDETDAFWVLSSLFFYIPCVTFFCYAVICTIHSCVVTSSPSPGANANAVSE